MSHQLSQIKWYFRFIQMTPISHFQIEKQTHKVGELVLLLLFFVVRVFYPFCFVVIVKSSSSCFIYYSNKQTALLCSIRFSSKNWCTRFDASLFFVLLRFDHIVLNRLVFLSCLVSFVFVLFFFVFFFCCWSLVFTFIPKRVIVYASRDVFGFYGII